MPISYKCIDILRHVEEKEQKYTIFTDIVERNLFEFFQADGYFSHVQKHIFKKLVCILHKYSERFDCEYFI